MAFLATSAYQHKGKRWTSEDPNEASTTANRNSQPSSVRSGVSSTKPRSSTASGDSHRSVAAEPPQQTTKRRSPPGSSTQFTSDLQDPAPIGVNIPPSSNQGGRGHRSSTYPPVDSSKLGPSARNALIVATVVGNSNSYTRQLADLTTDQVVYYFSHSLLVYSGGVEGGHVLKRQL